MEGEDAEGECEMSVWTARYATAGAVTGGRAEGREGLSSPRPWAQRPRCRSHWFSFPRRQSVRGAQSLLHSVWGAGAQESAEEQRPRLGVPRIRVVAPSTGKGADQGGTLEWGGRACTEGQELGSRPPRVGTVGTKRGQTSQFKSREDSPEERKGERQPQL